MKRARLPSHLKSSVKPLAAAVIQCLMFSHYSVALPTAPEITAGDASVSFDAATMTIQQASDRVVLEYQQFNLQAQERVQFIQPSSSAIALNKVIGPDASTIAGQMDANGHIYLVNTHGVFFSPTAQVDVSGLVVTTLDINRDDFMAGDFTLAAPGIGKIVNQGDLSATQLLAFISPVIENSGTLDSSAQLELHSAGSVIISPQFAHTGFSVASELITDQDSGLTNTGAISGKWVEISTASLSQISNSVINNEGVIQAKNLDDLLGGTIHLTNENGVIRQSGSLEANHLTGTGGHISVTATDVILQGSTTATGGHQGGSVDIVSANSAVLAETHVTDVSATMNGAGGSLDIQSRTLLEAGTSLANAAGAGDGGRINYESSENITIRETAYLKANADKNGSGGFVRAFSPNATAFVSGAHIDAKAGTASGDGGFVEISGWQYVHAEGAVNTLAPNGETGLFYIDPVDIDIAAFNTPGDNFDGAGLWVVAGTSSIVDAANINTQLQTTNVTIDATTGAGGAGSLTVSAPINLDGANGRVLTLRGVLDVLVDFNITGTDTTSANSADLVIESTSGSVTVASGTTLNAGQNSIQILAATDATIDGLLTSENTSDTAIAVTAVGNISGLIDASANLVASAGGINLNGGAINNLEIDGAKLTLTTTAGSATIRELDDVTLLAASVGANDLAITGLGGASMGSLTIADGGLSITGNLLFNVDDIKDSDRNIILGANNLDITSAFSGADLTIAGDINSLDLVNSGANTLTLSDANAFTLNSFAVTGGGGLTLQAVGDLTVGSAIDTDGNNGATLTFSSTAGDLLINADINDSNTGTVDDLIINLNAANNITMLDGTVVAAYGGSINALSSTGDITLSSLYTTNNTSTAITVNAGNRILDGGDINQDIRAINGEAWLTAKNGIVDIEIQVDNLTLANTVSGDISVIENNSVILDSLTAAGNTSITANARIEIPDGAIATVQNLTLDSVDLQLGDAGINTVAGTLNITAQDIYDSDRSVFISAPTLVINTALTLGDLAISGDVDNLDFTNSAGNNLTFSDSDDINLTQLALSGGDFQLVAGGNLTLANAIDTNGSDGSYLNFTTSLGDIFINGGIDDSDTAIVDSVNIDFNAENNITMTDGVRVHARVGVLNLTATNGDITVAGLASTQTSGYAINLNAGNRILDGGDSAVDIQATSGNFLLTAINGIGDGNALEVSGVNANFLNTGSGNIFITDETGNLSINTLTSIGDSTFTAFGNITLQPAAVTTVQMLSLTAGGDIILDDAGITNVATSFVADALDIYDSDRTISIDAPVMSITTTLAAGDTTINTTATSATLNKVSANTLLVNKVDVGDLQIINNNTGTGGLNIALFNGALQVNSSGLTTGSTLSVSANDIFDLPNDRIITLGGSDVFLTLLGTNSPLRVNSFASLLNLSGTSATDLTLSRNAGGDLQLVSASAWNGNLTVEALGGILTLPDAGLASVGNLQLNAGDVVDSLGRDLLLSGVNVGLNLTGPSGDITLHTTANILNFISATATNLTVIETDALTLNTLDLAGGNATLSNSTGNLTFANVTNVNNFIATAASGDIVIPDTGLLVSGNSTLTANDLYDLDRALILAGTNLAIALNAPTGGLTLNTTATTLDYSSAALSNLTVIETDALTLNTLDLAGGNATLSNSTGNLTFANVANVNNFIATAASGDIVIPDTGLLVSGNSTLTANDLYDLDRALILAGTNLTMTLAAAAGNLIVNTNVNALDVALAQRNLTVNSNATSGLTLADLDSDGFSVKMDNGNFTLNLLQGSLLIQDQLLASDNVADGVRSGLMGFYISAGNLTIQDGANIQSVNNVDQNVNGGLMANDQTALLFQQLDTSDTTYSWTVGTGAGSVLIETVGGDIVFDNFNNSVLSTATRNLTLSDNSVLRSFNSLVDPQTGTLIDRTASYNSATLEAYAARQISLLTTSASAPPAAPPAAPMERPVDLESVNSDSTQTSTADVVAPKNPEPERSSVQQLLATANGPCDNSTDQTANQKRCANQATINRFLNSLLVSGQLPKINRQEISP